MDIIATRTFNNPENGATYEVLIGRPVEVDRDEWRCDVEIRGPHGTTKDRTFGIDALQALMLSFDAVRNNLNSISPSLTWLDLPVDLAIPRGIPNVLGEDFYRRMEAHIDATVEAEVEELSRRGGKR